MSVDQQHRCLPGNGDDDGSLVIPPGRLWDLRCSQLWATKELFEGPRAHPVRVLWLFASVLGRPSMSGWRLAVSRGNIARELGRHEELVVDEGEGMRAMAHGRYSMDSAKSPVLR